MDTSTSIVQSGRVTQSEPPPAGTRGDDEHDAEAVCAICGLELRHGDVAVEVQGRMLHADCVDPPEPGKRRQVGRWAAFGAGGQMTMGDVQRDTPT